MAEKTATAKKATTFTEDEKDAMRERAKESKAQSRRDPEAFRRLVERYAPLVGGICRRCLGDAHAAEDAVQTTFLALARRPGLPRRAAQPLRPQRQVPRRFYA